MNRLTFDFETQSAAELKKTGAYKYSLDLSTKPTCLAIKVHGGREIFLDFYEINTPWVGLRPMLRILWKAFIRQRYEFSAHNAFFEKCIYQNIMVARYGWPEIPFELYRCTAAKAAACALPRNLAGAGDALNLPIQKDKGGFVPMMLTCKPTKAWKAWDKNKEKWKVSKLDAWKEVEPEPEMFLTPADSPDVYERLYVYCRIDARAEVLLDEALPDLSPEEQEIWHLNQKMNWRGLRMDIPTVKKVVDIMAVESKKKLKQLDTLTMGLVTKPGARKSIFEFLELEGVKLPNLQKQTVEDKLQGFELSPDMHQLLELRKALTMTSTKKYQTFLNRANEDHRVRDIMMYHGASTGRDTGIGIQPHNFPKGVIWVDKRRPYAPVENVVECDRELLTILYGNSLAMLFSSILRNMIIPSDGYELFVGDYSKIEVAVCWWLAGNEPGLEVLRLGKDPYIYQAAQNMGCRYDEINDPSPERDLGKAQTLGCQFGMGAPKFQKTAWDVHRLKLSDEQSKFAVDSYRRSNPTVPQLWKDYERAAVEAVETGDNGRLVPTIFRAGRCKFYMKQKFLVVCLPSGRKLRYREPQIAWRETDYGPRKTLEFWAVNSKTKKWGIERTWGGTITENIVQGTARDLLMPAMVRLENAGYRALLTVHDEAICERKLGKGDVKEFVEILCQAPSWGKGLPIDAKAWVGPRYRK